MPTIGRGVEARYWVTEAPTIKLRDGVFVIGYEVGETFRFEIAMSPNVWNKTRRLACEVSEEFNSRKSVVPLRRRKTKPAHG